MKLTAEALIQFLERQIQGCDEKSMDREKWAFQQCLEFAQKPYPALPDDGEDYTEEFNEWWDKTTAKSDQWTTLERSAAYAAYVYAKRNPNQTKPELMKKIITNKIKPPIPIRIYDWEAYREGLDEGDPIGRGETKDDAIKDLKIQEKELQPN